MQVCRQYFDFVGKIGLQTLDPILKFMFSKKATKNDQIFTALAIWHYVVSVKSNVKISSIFVAFLENTNFIGL